MKRTARLHEPVSRLTAMVMAIRLTELTVMTGTTLRQASLAAMRLKSAQLLQAVDTGQPVATVRAAFDEATRAVQAGEIVGIIGAQEVKRYQDTLQEIQHILDKET